MATNAATGLSQHRASSFRKPSESIGSAENAMGEAPLYRWSEWGERRTHHRRLSTHADAPQRNASHCHGRRSEDGEGSCEGQAVTLATVDRLIPHSIIFEVNVGIYCRKAALCR